MKKQQTQAQNEYIVAKETLFKFCEKFTKLTPCVLDDQYPIRVQFIPNPQFTIFGDENVDENGEINDLTVSVGLTTDVKSTLKFKMDSKLLKKLIKLAETVGFLYYHAFCEEQGERNRPTRPTVSEDGNRAYCPGCGEAMAVVDEPFKHCPECGQALDWTPEPRTDFDEGLERLRELCNGKEGKQ